MRRTTKADAGFSIIELLVVVIIMGIIAAIGVPSYMTQMKTQTLKSYGANMEHVIKYGKLMAMERTSNIGICVNSATQLIIYDMGTNRGAAICSGTAITNMTIASNHATGYGISVNGSGAAIDPRGVSIWTGNVCVTDGSKYIKVVVSKIGLRTEEGAGGCT